MRYSQSRRQHNQGRNPLTSPPETDQTNRASSEGRSRVELSTTTSSSGPVARGYRHLADDLIAAHRDIPALMPYLHLPFQAGADRILAAMNRRHTADDYLRLVDRIRKACPEMALSTDIIVGFPGETAEEFEATMDMVRRVEFASAYSFKYSPRPGTPAATLGEQVPEAEKARRLGALQSLLNEQQAAFNAAQIGRDLAVLIEKKGRKPGQMAGRSPYLQAVHVDAGEDMAGHILLVRIHEAGPNSLSGVIISHIDSSMVNEQSPESQNVGLL